MSVLGARGWGWSTAERVDPVDPVWAMIWPTKFNPNVYRNHQNHPKPPGVRKYKIADFCRPTIFAISRA